MDEPFSYLRPALQVAGAMQLGIALLNLRLEQIMGWREDMERMPLLIREVHRVHAWFISVTLGIFATMTWRFSAEFATRSYPVCQWLAAGIGLFWGFRVVLQFGYYSASHWRGRPGRTAIHVLLLAMYGGFAAVYLLSAFGHPR